MAQQKQEQKQSEEAAHWRAFGLQDDIVVEPDPNAGQADEDQTDASDGESDESEGGDSADASKEGEAKEALDDLKADKGDEGDEELSDEDKSKQVKDKKKSASANAAERRAEAAEKEMRKMQAERDRAQSQLNQQMSQFWSELRRMQQGTQTNSSTGEDLPNIDDDAVVDGKTIKGLYRGEQAKRQQQEAVHATQQQKLNWISSQAEIADVRKLVADEKWADNTEIMQTPTDSVGMYFRALARIRENKIAAMEKAHKQEIEKAKSDERKKFANRQPVPPVGGHGGGSRSAVESLAPSNDFERRFLGFVRKVDKNAKILQHGR